MENIDIQKILRTSTGKHFGVFYSYMNRSKTAYISGGLSWLFLLFTSLALTDCKTSSTPPREIERAIYFWKSDFRPSEYEKNNLARLNIKTIYVKFFDVGWDPQKNIAYPMAVLHVTDQNYFLSNGIIPVVFITNQCLQRIDSAQCPELAKKILKLVKGIGGSETGRKFGEIQIDCDWTAATKDKYFSILRKLHDLEPGILFSATIRLYQVKFAGKTGIPPVSRGMLMCYNMGNMRDPSAKNSILDINEFKKYISGLNRYPLPLDIALPIFEWAVLLRKGTYAGLLENLPAGKLNSSFFKKSENTYEVLKSNSVLGYDLIKGDKIRVEESKYADLKSAVNILNSKITPGNLRVSLYHLDSLTLSKYSQHELEILYDGMH